MLHIKLPKGKVASACERAGQYYSQMNRAKLDQYRADLEAWRKSGLAVNYPPTPPTLYNHNKARELLSMAEACSFSTGDVYVSAALWNEIKGWYDA